MIKKEYGLFRKLIVCAILTISIYNAAPAQSFFKINWEKSYDFNLSDKLFSVINTSDGNFILAGETSSNTSPGQKILILKVNPNGELIWQKTFGGASDCKFMTTAKAGIDGLFILGTKKTGSSNPFIWILKIDKDGNLIWENTAGGGGSEFIYDLYESPENGVFLCGSKQIKGNNDSDGWLIKFNKKGAIESQALFGPRYIDDDFRSIISDNTGGYFLIGNTSEKIGSEKIPYLVHVDFRGNKIWEKSFPDFPGSIPASVFFNSEGLITCLLNVYSGTGEFSHITKILVEPGGTLVTSNSINQHLNISKNSVFFNEFDQLVLTSVQAENPPENANKYIIKLDQALNPIWVKQLDLENISVNSIRPVDNTNFISAGWTGLNAYKLDAKIFSFRDYSGKLIESYVIQKLIANAGMNVNESLKDYKLRIGNARFQTLIAEYSVAATTELRLVPETYSSAPVAARSEVRTAPANPIQGNTVSSPQVSISGKYYALLIAVEDYADPVITDLDKPIKDAQKLFDVLVNEYLFEKANVTFLKNPTREQIISSLDRLEKEVTKSDNLLIFYAGHGYWNETSQKGFWLPSDASKKNTSNWIANSSVSDYIRSIPAKHTLLIADACFSGSIFKTRAAFGSQDMSAMKLYELTSRKAMTSGTLTEVPDKSVFIDFLVKRLYENPDHYLPSEQLFFSFKPAVVNNTESIPQFGVVGNSGDEGGDFIFVKRKK